MTNQRFALIREAIEQLIACHDEPTCPAIELGRSALAALSAHTTPAQEAVAGEGALRAALTELVACKDLKDAMRAYRSDPYCITQADHLESQYDQRQPLAWVLARAALSAPATPAQLAMDMALCEIHSVVIRPGQAYTFSRVGDCEKCAEMEREAIAAYEPLGVTPIDRPTARHALPQPAANAEPPAAAMVGELPEHLWIVQKQHAGAEELTTLEQFIFDNEPAGREAEASFRNGLAAVVNELAARPAAPEEDNTMRESDEIQGDDAKEECQTKGAEWETLIQAAMFYGVAHVGAGRSSNDPDVLALREESCLRVRTAAQALLATKDARIAKLTAERDVAFAMSHCECSASECCAALVSKDARIAELEANGIHTCGPDCKRTVRVMGRRIAELEAALDTQGTTFDAAWPAILGEDGKRHSNMADYRHWCLLGWRAAMATQEGKDHD